MMKRQRILSKGFNDDVSRFIWCVRQRPALYNYKLAPQERRRVDVAKGWRDVAKEIGGKLTAEDCRKKWKNLRDTYHQYRLRKSKFKDCLEKWRYTNDLSFLTDIYQPKLKSKRSTYQSEHSSSSNNALYRVDEVKVSSIASLIDVDDNTSTSDQKINEDSLTENDYEESYENVDINEVQFCEVDDVADVKTNDEDYGEVCLYEDNQTSVVTVDALQELNGFDRKYESNGMRIINNPGVEPQKSVQLTIGIDKDELDLFFQFLKSKIQKLAPVDITAIQIEFLNAVLRKESANAQNM